MRFVISFLSLILAATTINAKTTAVFNCEMLSATSMTIENGRLGIKAERPKLIGKKIQFQIFTEPYSRNEDSYQVDIYAQSDGPQYFSDDPTPSYTITTSPNFMFCGDIMGGFSMNENTITFFNSTGGYLKLSRYYKNDFDGVMVSSGAVSHYTTMVGLNCMDAKFDLYDFIEFHNSWNN